MKKKYKKYENLDEDTKRYIEIRRKKRFYYCIILSFVAVIMIITGDFLYYHISLRATVNGYKNELENIVDCKKYIPQREILDRMYLDDQRDDYTGMKKANDECDIDYDADMERSKVRLEIKQYDYENIYKTSLREANEIIKEKKVKDRLKKNEILSECLRENFKRAEEKGDKKTYTVHTIYHTPSGGIDNGSYLEHDNNYEDKYDLYDAFFGGLQMAMEDEPCDYLLLKNEYKIYDDLTESIVGYVDKFRNDKKYKKYNDIINEFDDVDMGFDELKKNLDINYGIVMENSQVVNVNIDSFEYGNGYKYASRFIEDYISLKEKDLTDKEREKLFLKEFKNYVKDSFVDTYVENLPYSYKKDKYGYNKYYITPSEEQEEKLYNAFVGGLVEAMN
ncbi:hypothetical protein [Anaerofustis sp.]|uniref:hypothetical protein n=1 Tax=Anaerofustis sp. TaxID=1872517 RepID=UPI0025BB79E0|nr:hypothetical protein [Anaerofustis sp.]